MHFSPDFSTVLFCHVTACVYPQDARLHEVAAHVQEWGWNLSFKLILTSICINLPLHVEFICITQSRLDLCRSYFAQPSGLLFTSLINHTSLRFFPQEVSPEIISTVALPPGASDQYDAAVWPGVPTRPPPFARLSFSCVRRDKALDLSQNCKNNQAPMLDNHGCLQRSLL